MKKSKIIFEVQLDENRVPEEIKWSAPDGGINNETIGIAAKAGADTFVAGSAIFNTNNYEETISMLRSKIT